MIRKHWAVTAYSIATGEAVGVRFRWMFWTKVTAEAHKRKMVALYPAPLVLYRVEKL